MAKKDDTVSKRLAKEIALAKRIKDNPASPSLLDLATPDQLDELAAEEQLCGGPGRRTPRLQG